MISIMLPTKLNIYMYIVSYKTELRIANACFIYIAIYSFMAIRTLFYKVIAKMTYTQKVPEI